VRRQGLEPRTRGLRARTWSCRDTPPGVDPGRSAGQRECAVSSSAVRCQFVPRPPSTDRAPRRCFGARCLTGAGKRRAARRSRLLVRWSHRAATGSRHPGGSAGSGTCRSSGDLGSRSPHMPHCSGADWGTGVPRWSAASGVQLLGRSRL